MVRKVLAETGITATAGIGTNMYLAKIAMDIVAKKAAPDRHGVRIAELDEASYRSELWGHTPMTDFWRVGPGIARRLRRLGIHTMGELARYSLVGSDKLYATFGKNAELIIDHAWGWEPVTMPDVKGYTTDNHSISMGQVLHEPYDFNKARLVTWEMADAVALDLYEKGLATDQLILDVVYDTSSAGRADEVVLDYYGRKVPRPAHGTINLDRFTNSEKTICDAVDEEFIKLCSKKLMVRRIMIAACHVKQRENEAKIEFKNSQRDFFTDYEKIEKDERRAARLAAAEVAIKKRYGKNAVMRAANYEEGATMRVRNNQIGGHRA